MEILTVSEVAQLLRVGKNTVYRALEEGELPGFKIRGCWRIPRVELDQWVRAGGSQASPLPEKADVGMLIGVTEPA